jgi:superfamily II DNA or RNA helicase
MNPTQTVDALRAAAPAPLAAWIAANLDLLRATVTRAQSAPTPQRQRGTRTPRPAPAVPGFLAADIPVDVALAQLQAWAQTLTDRTHYDPMTGKMLKDKRGFSAADAGFFAAYGELDLPDISPEDHYRAAQSLIKYAKTQLGGAELVSAFVERVRDWAIGARQQRFADAAVNARRTGRNVDGEWRVSPDTGAIAVFWGDMSTAGHVENQIEKLGLDLKRKEDWTALPIDNRWHIVLRNTDKVEEFTKLLEAYGKKELATVISAAAPRWAQEVKAEQAQARAAVERAAVERARVQAPQYPPGQGTVQGVRYVWDKERFRILWFPSGRALDWSAATFGPSAGYDRLTGADGRTQGYASTLSVDPKKLAEAVTFARSRGHYAFADAVEANAATWSAARSSLEQSRDAGTAEGGRWKVQTVTSRVRDPKTRLFVDKEQKWIHIWLNRVSRDLWGMLRPWNKDLTFDGAGWRYVVNEKGLRAFLDLIRSEVPRLAEAMTRAYGGVATVMDSEVERCEPLVALSQAVSPDVVTNPKARAAIAAVRQAFAAHGPKGLSPLPFQEVGIAYAKLAGYRALIADSMGLGKTIQGIGCVIADPDENLPCLVVAPASVVYNWAREILRWTGRMRVPVQILRGSTTAEDADEVEVEERVGGRRIRAVARARPVVFEDIPGDVTQDTGRIADAGFVVCSWDTLVARQREIVDAGFKLMIVDEAHYGKNTRTQRSKALQTVGAQIPHLVLLTGTPFKNALEEIHPLLSAVDPKVWGTQKAFSAQYDGIDAIKSYRAPNDDGEDTTELRLERIEELRTRLACTLIRRKKGDVLDLPPKKRIMIGVEMTPEERVKYQKADMTFRAWLESEVTPRVRAEIEKMGLDPDTASQIIREQVEESVTRSMEAEALTQLSELRQLASKIKVPAAIDLIHKLKESIIVWTAFLPTVVALEHACAAAGLRFATIEGSTLPATRAAIAEGFQQGQIDVLIATTAAREGLTLTRAAKAIFVDRFWSPADEVQAEDRIYRIGQKKPVEIIKLHLNYAGARDQYHAGSVDDYMHKLNKGKAALTEAVLGDDSYETVFRRKNRSEFVRLMLKRRRR